MLDQATREALQRRHYPNLEQEVFGPLYDALTHRRFQGATVLDAGCGPGTWILESLKPHFKLLVGLDVYAAHNELADAFGVGSLERLPFANEAFDLILCYNVLEHLAEPTSALAELARALRPGGTLLLKMPAAYAPTSLITRLLPYRAHCRLKGLIGVDEDEVFPTYFRANTVRDLRRLLGQAGLVIEMMHRIDQTYAYTSLRPWTYVLGLRYSRLIQQPGWSWLRSGIVCAARKEPVP